MHNNKKTIAKLTLITGDEVISENGSKLLQSLKLEINNKKFTFYINDINTINYEKEIYPGTNILAIIIDNGYRAVEVLSQISRSCYAAVVR